MSDELILKINREFVKLIKSVEKHQETLQKLLTKFSECEDSSIHRDFFKQLLENLESKKEEIRACSSCKFCSDGSFVCETCDTGFTNYEPKDSGKKEYIASLNDPKAFEAVNLGTLERTRVKGSKGEKDVNEVNETGGATPTRNVELDTSVRLSDDSKPFEPRENNFYKFLPCKAKDCEFKDKNGQCTVYMKEEWHIKHTRCWHVLWDIIQDQIEYDEAFEYFQWYIQLEKKREEYLINKEISEFIEFLTFKSGSLEGSKSLVVFNKKDFEEELKKWKERING